MLSQQAAVPPMVNVYHVFQNGKAGSCFESNKMACLEKEARRPIRKTTISPGGLHDKLSAITTRYYVAQVP